MIQLSIIIPAFNVEIYLNKCLKSLTDEFVLNDIEVIIIDDGSSDNTSKIALEYVHKFSKNFRLVQKENGGHGSVINLGVALANGRYFKILDADDWLINLKKFVEILKKTQADVVITGYQSIHKNGKILEFSSKCKIENQEVGLSQLLSVYHEISSCCSFHGITYKTQTYLESGTKLTENIFYDDQEFSCVPFKNVKTIKIAPIYFYQYAIGNENQSVSYKNQVKYINNIEKVCFSIINHMNSCELTQETKEFYMRKLSVVVVSYFVVALIKNPNKKQGIQQSKEFEKKLNIKNSEIMIRVKKKLKILKLLNKINISPDMYQNFLDSGGYRKLRKLYLK